MKDALQFIIMALAIGASPPGVARENDPLFRVNSVRTDREGVTTRLRVVADASNTLGPSHTLTAVTSATADAVLEFDATEDGEFELTIDHARPQDGDGLTVRVTASNGSFVDDVSSVFWFEWSDGALSELTFDEQRAREFEGTTLAAPAEEPLAAPPELAHLDPRVNPDLRPEDRAYAEWVLGPLGELGSIEAPLTSDPEGNTPESLEPTGCNGGSIPWLALASLPMFLMLRRRGFACALVFGGALLAVTGSGSSAEAKTVYGYIAFWDTRIAMSDYAGSKLPTCDSGDTTCGPADGLDCCFRPIPNATVVIQNAGMSPLAVEANENGFFLFTGFQGNDNYSYTIFVVYGRTGDPVAMEMWSGSSGPPIEREVFKATLPSSTTYLPRLNVNSASDTTSAEGNVASIWTSVTDAQWGITWEGDSRFRRDFGEPSNDPDDPITIGYWSKVAYDCADSMLWLSAAVSRSLTPPALMGGLYQGRVVGCAASSIGDWNLAAFPPNPMETSAQNFSGSESTRHHLAYRDVTAFLSRWNSANTAIGNMKTALGYACSSDSLSNSNDAAWLKNNALALWEFIDADTSGSDGGFSDDVNIRMKEVMDSLFSLSQWPGNPGDNASSVEAIFTQYSPADTCVDNQGCPNGDACVYASGQGPNCYHGDPHGSNIYDLVIHMILLDWTYNWTGGGDFLNTLKSSACIGSADNSYQFTGGFRDD